MQVTERQHEFLTKLQVPKTDIAKLTKAGASELISKRLAEKDAAPPTGPQLQLLNVSGVWTVPGLVMKPVHAS